MPRAFGLLLKVSLLQCLHYHALRLPAAEEQQLLWARLRVIACAAPGFGLFPAAAQQLLQLGNVAASGATA